MTQTIFRRRAFATIATAAGVSHRVAGARQLQGTWRTRLSKSDRSHDPAWHSPSSRPAHSAVDGAAMGFDSADRRRQRFSARYSKNVVV